MPSVCFACGAESKITELQQYYACRVECPICGRYIVENDMLKDDRASSDIQNGMFYFLHNIWKPRKGVQIHFYDNPNWGKPGLEDNGHYFEHADDLIRLLPQNFTQQVDKSLLNLASKYDGFGEEIELLAGKGAPNSLLKVMCFASEDDSDEGTQRLAAFLHLLAEMGYLSGTSDAKAVRQVYRLTAKAWLRVQELQQQNKVLEQGFVAMWFDESMKEARNAIIKAIEDCGYLSRIIDIKEHNNQIVPEIFFEIKQSRFVVADLSGHRNGVYYEAGYGEALGKEVILTCSKEEFDKRHFDVAQKNTIQWKNEADLYERLVNRIISTVGKL